MVDVGDKINTPEVFRFVFSLVSRSFRVLMRGLNSSGNARTVLVDDDGHVHVDIESGGGGGDATAANQTTMITHLSEIEGAVETIEGAVSGSEMQADIVSAVWPDLDEAVYPTPSVTAFGSISSSYTTVITAGGSLSLIEIFNDTDVVIVASFDGGTTAHAYIPRQSGISRDLAAMGLTETGNVSIKDNGTSATFGAVYANAAR